MPDHGQETRLISDESSPGRVSVVLRSRIRPDPSNFSGLVWYLGVMKTRHFLTRTVLGTAILLLTPAAIAKDYTLVMILTGPASDVPREDQQTAFEGHFSNMERLADDGDLLVAGPFGPPKASDDHRGLWILDTGSTDRADRLAATDPPGHIGIFVYESFVLRTDDPITECYRLEQEDENRRLADPDIPDEWQGRAYIIATAPSDECQAPGPKDSIIIHAQIEGTQGGRFGEDQHFLVLDATTPAQAREVLERSGSDPDTWTLHGWYSTTVLTRLPGLREPD